MSKGGCPHSPPGRGVIEMMVVSPHHYDSPSAFALLERPLSAPSMSQAPAARTHMALVYMQRGSLQLENMRACMLAGACRRSYQVHLTQPRTNRGDGSARRLRWLCLGSLIFWAENEQNQDSLKFNIQAMNITAQIGDRKTTASRADIYCMASKKQT